MLHGIARTVLVAPRIGKERAIKVSIVSGTLLAYLVCYLLVPRVALAGSVAHLLLGIFVAAFMAAFDIAVGRLILRFSWPRIFRDFNPASGNYLSVGLVLLAGAPLVVWWLHQQRGV